MPSNSVAPEDNPTTAPPDVEQPKQGTADLHDDSMDAQCMKYAGPDPGFFEKGNISNIFTFVFMVIGVVLRIIFDKDDDWEDFWVGRIILAFGLFGFAGGVTNWLAVKMLFDEIPGVYGSGIIPKQFIQIKVTIKKMIMDTFFEPKFLEKQLKEKLGAFADKEFVKEKMAKILDSPEFEKVLDEKLEKAAGSATGMMLSMFNVTGAKLKPFIKPFISAMSTDIAGLISSSLEDGKSSVPIMKLRDEVDRLMEERLKELTAQRIKLLVEAVMRAHLGWLVVWGNVFGGVIGVVSEAAGY